MRTEQFSSLNGNRPNVQNLAIIISKGHDSTDSGQMLTTEAQIARASGIKMLSIGVTSQDIDDEVRSMSSRPQELNHNYFTLDTSAALGLILDDVVEETCQQAVEADRCARDHVDLVFVLDCSGSIRDNNPTDGSYDNFELLLNFVTAIVNRLSIGPDASRVGVVTYSNTASNIIYLNDFGSKYDLIDAIMRIGYLGGTTNTSGALQVMRTEQFTSENGDRPNVPNVAIVVTDGRSTVDADQTLPQARAARDDGIQMFAVGITSDIDIYEVRGISSEPQLLGESYFTSTDFTNLNDIVDNLLNNACTDAQTSVAMATNIDFCFDDRLDLVFVVDSSARIRDFNPPDGSHDNWHVMLEFMVEIVNTLVVNRDKTRIGLVRYSSEATNEFYLDTHSNRYDTKQAILNLEYVGLQRNTSEGVRMMHRDQFRKKHGDRKNAPNVAIVLTTGPSETQSDTDRALSYARKARRSDVTIYTVAVTDDSHNDVYEYKKLSSSPQKQDKNYFLVPGFESLADFRIALKCDGECSKNLDTSVVKAATPACYI